MIIEYPQTKQHESRHAFVSKVEIENKNMDFPETLWFSLRGDPSFEYPALSDAFLIGMLPIAMKLGESIRVAGPVSERLAYGLQTYQSILNCWWPDIFTVIDVNYAEVSSRHKDVQPEGVGSCFSGGVDSFYTVLKHLPEQQRLKDYQLTHAVKINGFDQIAGFEEESSMTFFYDNYRPVLEKWGIKLLMIDSNLGAFRIASSLKRANCYGTPLLASAHVLGNLFSKFIIPGHASYAHEDLIPMSSNPLIDHHLGSDQLQIIHHADGTISRRNKIEFIADLPEVQQHLRVCFRDLDFDMKSGEVSNCCKCLKCLRTLITLELIGKIEFFKTFPHRHDKTLLKNIQRLSMEKRLFLLDNLKLAKKTHNREWTHILEKAIRINVKLEHEKQLNNN